MIKERAWDDLREMAICKAEITNLLLLLTRIYEKF